MLRRRILRCSRHRPCAGEKLQMGKRGVHAAIAGTSSAFTASAFRLQEQEIYVLAGELAGSQCQWQKRFDFEVELLPISSIGKNHILVGLP